VSVKTVEFQMVRLSTVEAPSIEPSPLPIPDPPSYPDASICELEIETTPIDEQDPGPLAYPVPIPDRSQYLLTTTVEFQIARSSIRETPSE
jgi:hypothetical protein